MTSQASSAPHAGFVDATAQREYVRLAVGCFLVYFTSAHATLLAVVFSRDGYDLHAIGLLLSLISISIIGFALLSGEVIARIGALGCLRVAMVCVIVGFGTLEWTRFTFGPALASRLVQGIGQGLYLAAAYVYIQSRLDSTRFLFLLGVFSAAMPLSQGVAPPFGGFILDRWGETAFFAAAVVPGVIGLALTIGLRSLPRPPSTGGMQIVAGWRPGAWEPLLAVFMNGTLFGFCTAYLAVALRERGVPLAAFFTATLVTMFASRLLALRSIEAMNRRLLVGAGLGLMSAGLAAVAVAGNQVWPVVLGGISFGFGYSLTYPVLSAWITEGVVPERRAGGQALLNTAFNVGLFAMPFPETWLVATFGYNGALVTLAGMGFATTILLVGRMRLRS